ncbi:hypothetical protein A2V82_16610 [candidate division KSB1 bacterium RBG_16_48_16]|nr:MAG: hypothetical protein A2V82_16610 [candidate division KSB1 bacterium RBG_16_48_16]
MSRLEKLRSRYLKDPIPMRLGGLAANLARVASFSKHDGHQHAVSATIAESKWFIEWTANDLDVEQTAELVRLQSQLARWELQSRNSWNDEKWRQELLRSSQQWSEQLIKMSGLATS